MQIISTHPAHQHEVLTTGQATVNGLTFTAGEGGKPTAYGVRDYQCEMFVGVPGFQFIGDDGRLVGETGLKDNRVKLDVVTSAIKSGEVTIEELRRMDLQIPGIGNLNGLIDAALDPMNSRTDAASPSAAEQEAIARLSERASDPSVEQQLAARIAADMGVPESDVTMKGENVLLSGYAAELAVEGLLGGMMSESNRASAGDEDGGSVSPPTAEEVAQAAKIAADLGVPESDVTIRGDDIILSGAAAQLGREGLMAAMVDNLSEEDRARAAGKSESDDGLSIGDLDKKDTDDSEGDSDEDPQPARTQLTKAQIKDRLAELNIGFSPRDTHGELLSKLEAAQALLP